MKLDIFGDSISYVTDEVSTVKIEEANLNEDNRIKFVTDLAAISRGKTESVNPSKRYQQLLKEAALGTASRPLEFLPIILKCSINEKGYITINNLNNNKKDLTVDYGTFINDIGRYSYIEHLEKDNYLIYTNMRAIINSSYFVYEDIPYMTEDTQDLYKKFKAIKLKIPMFIWSQWPMTHTKLSKESQSDRVTGQGDYWLPSDIEKRANETLRTIRIRPEGSVFYIDTVAKLIDRYNNNEFEGRFKTFEEFFKSIMIHSVSQEEIQDFLNECDYKREIWSRAPYYFKYKEVIVTGWYNDPTTWKHSFIERNCEPELWKNWTQKETQQVLQKVKQIINKE